MNSRESIKVIYNVSNILGSRYKYRIEYGKNNENCSFEIISCYLQENKKSFITNLNFIISEIIYPIYKASDIETTLIVSKILGDKLYRKAISCFRDEYWIRLLEKYLDEDRKIGGWNSNYNI